MDKYNKSIENETSNWTVTSNKILKIRMKKIIVLWFDLYKIDSEW